MAFDGSHGIDVELGGSRIVIPAAALTRAGKPDRDRARLAFTLLDVTSPCQRAAAPGDFSGRLLDRSIRRLSSFGIFDLAVTDAADRPLELAAGLRAERAIAVPRALAERAPRSVGFYELRPADGRWVQVGTFAYAPDTSFFATPFPPTFTAPNFSSGAGDCGNAATCPLLGTIQVDLLVGLPSR